MHSGVRDDLSCLTVCEFFRAGCLGTRRVKGLGGAVDSVITSSGFDLVWAEAPRIRTRCMASCETANARW